MAAKNLLCLATILFAVLDMTLAYCPDNGWTAWFDRDDPTNKADYELLEKLKRENPGEICIHPTDIQARLVNSKTLYSSIDPNIVMNPAVGFACFNSGIHQCQDYEVRFCCPFGDFDYSYAKCPVGHKWTEWFDRDNPSGRADYEILSDLTRENPGKICERPSDIEARTVGTKIPYVSNEPNIVFNAEIGLACWNTGSQNCQDYEVRFCCPSERVAEANCPAGHHWTSWFDRDDPSGFADYESLYYLRRENPGKICASPVDIQARTIGSKEMFHYNNEPNFILNPKIGFACWVGHDSCKDYEVRFCCPN